MASKTKKKPRWVAVSGGFDPIHIGHVRMFKEARKLGDKLMVILNNDHWLKSKKGFAFMPQKERAELIQTFPYVDRVVLTDHKRNDTDRSVARMLRTLRPHVFANGGDRKPSGDPVPEVVVCMELGIKIVYNVGRGGKVQSSSWMIREASRALARSVRPWGEFYQWDQGKDWNLKTTYIQPGEHISLQYHKRRSEWWMLVEGDATATVEKNGKKMSTKLTRGEIFKIGPKTVHQLESKKGGTIVEIAFGGFDEEDIVRLPASSKSS